MKKYKIPTTILSIMLPLAAMGIASEAKAGGPCGVCNICGNSQVGAGEQCDDGNTANGDGCSSSCQFECGNNQIDAGEECDDGNRVGGDGCDSQCQYEPACCGDYVLQYGEECDDGNTYDGDGCDSDCQFECGNNEIDDGEQCDDGNRDDNDGCDSECQYEPACCGDYVLQYGEQCDDGNTADGDGCDSECQFECGNGCIDAGEQCDDANRDDNDGCDSDCQLECYDGNDNDGVPACDDVCPGTDLTEGVPTSPKGLGVNRFALTNGDTIFDTQSPKGKGPQRYYTTEDTGGCSCEQIIDALDLGEGHTKFGCSISAMDDWIALLAQAAPAPGDEPGGLKAPEPIEDSLPVSEELDVSGVPQAGGCKMGGETRHAPAWAFLGLMFAAVGLRRRW